MMKRVGLASVSLLSSLALAPHLHAQTSTPPGPVVEPGKPTPDSITVSEPTTTTTTVTTESTTAATTAAAVAPPTPAPTTAGLTAVGGSTSASASTTAGADGTFDIAEPPVVADDDAAEREWRATSLHTGSALDGGTGTLHVAEAGAGAPGTFRLSVLGSYYKGDGFLCNGSTVCPVFGNESPASEDELTRSALHLGLSVTPLSFLEAFVGFHSHASSDDRGRPRLLQVLGDVNLGVKGFLPHAPDRIFSFGADAQVLFLNGTGGVGLDGDSTSALFRALGTLDLSNRSTAAARIPLRFHSNVGYMFNNSGKIVKDVEGTPPPQGRGAPISRIERFGLDIDRVDFFELGVAAEFVNDFVRPFAEYTVDIPVNRQDYTCVVREAAANGDQCLGLNQSFSTTPSRVTVGARGFPWPEHGLSLLLAVDIGTGAKSTFVQEVAPELPWNFHFGAGYAFDTVPPKPIIERIPPPPAPPPPAPPPPENVIEGVVVEKNTTTPIADAVIKYDGRPITGMVSGADGTFRTIVLEPGTYTFNVSAATYRDAQCVATIVPADAPAPSTAGSPAPAGGAAAPADSSAPPGMPSSENPGQLATKVQCELEALPKVGSVAGSVTDAENSNPIDGAHIEVTDRLNRKLELRADQNGAFRFENVPPGPLKFLVDAPGYFTAVAEVTVRVREEAQARMELNKRPAQPNVVVAGKEIKLKKQVHFQHDSATILPDSQAILEELADVMVKRADITSVEVQGHTDNTGAAPYNLRLSQSRAEAVVEALSLLGIDRSRMIAKGYGQEKPVVPNSTEANRAKNRRVQIIITGQDKASKATSGKATTK